MLVSVAQLSRAVDLTVSWEPVADDSITNYVIYASTNELTAANFRTAAQARFDAGTNTERVLQTVQPARWYFGVTVVSDTGIESDLSNVTIAVVPHPPAHVALVQYAPTLTSSNWENIGFIRLKTSQ